MHHCEGVKPWSGPAFISSPHWSYYGQYSIIVLALSHTIQEGSVCVGFCFAVDVCNQSTSQKNLAQGSGSGNQDKLDTAEEFQGKFMTTVVTSLFPV